MAATPSRPTPETTTSSTPRRAAPASRYSPAVRGSHPRRESPVLPPTGLSPFLPCRCDRQSHGADALDLRLQLVAGLNLLLELGGIGVAGGDEVARQEFGDAREIANQPGDAVDHAVGLGRLAQLAVDPQFHLERLGVCDLVARDDPWPGGGEGVEALA